MKKLAFKNIIRKDMLNKNYLLLPNKKVASTVGLISNSDIKKGLFQKSLVETFKYVMIIEWELTIKFA